MLQNLPQAELPRFMNCPDFESDGFAMMAHLLSRLQPSTTVHLIQDVVTMGNLEHHQGQDVLAYASEWRRLEQTFQNVSVVQLIPLLMLCWLDPEAFPGIRRSLEQGDPTLINGSLADIEERILHEQAIQNSFNFTPNTATSARRANTRPQPSTQTNSTIYPPQNVGHNIIQQFVIDNPKVCIGCWSKDPGHYHLTHGCPVLAAKNWVVKYHPTDAKAISIEHQEHKQGGRSGDGHGQSNGRGTGCGGRDGGQGKDGGGRGNNNANRASEEPHAPAPAPAIATRLPTIVHSNRQIVHRLLAWLQGGPPNTMMFSLTLNPTIVMKMVTHWMIV
jgi:uncharacterized membrane protein YgcG